MTKTKNFKSKNIILLGVFIFMEKQKGLFWEYKLLILYLLKFIFLYIIFTYLYNVYLNYQNGTDFFTKITAQSVQKIYDLFPISSQIESLNSSGMKLIINDKYVARIIEGCSGMSIIILFLAFVWSFGNIKIKTLYFIVVGILSIFAFNILRIALLGYVIYAFPDYQDLLHRVIFPALIYAWVIILWVYFILKIYDKK